MNQPFNWEKNTVPSHRIVVKIYKMVKSFLMEYSHQKKEIVERRHGEPIKFLFLPKMGLLGSQASNEKNFGCEL